MTNCKSCDLGESKNTTPRSMCPMLTHRGVTSIETLCQMMHPFRRLDLCNHTLCRLVALREIAHFFAIIILVVCVFSLPPAMLRVFIVTIVGGLFSVRRLCFHYNPVYWIRSSSSIFLFTKFFPITECILTIISVYATHKLFLKFVFLLVWLWFWSLFLLPIETLLSIVVFLGLGEDIA